MRKAFEIYLSCTHYPVSFGFGNSHIALMPSMDSFGGCIYSAVFERIHHPIRIIYALYHIEFGIFQELFRQKFLSPAHLEKFIFGIFFGNLERYHQIGLIVTCKAVGKYNGAVTVYAESGGSGFFSHYLRTAVLT